jgi:hypothetical protein
MNKKLIYLSVLCILISLSFGCSPTGLNENGDTDAAKRPVQEVRVVKEISMPGDIPFVDYNDPVLVDNHMYICVNDSYGLTNKVIDYDIDTQEYSIIFESQFTEANLQRTMANEKWVMWIDADLIFSRSIIYVFNRETNEIVKLADYNPSVQLTAPYLSGDYVACIVVQDYANLEKRQEIMLWNLDTMESYKVAEITELSFYNNFVFINSNQVLWTDSADGVGYYKIYDIETGLTKEIVSPYVYPGYAMLVGKKIYSINFQDYRYWGSQDFGYYDIATNTYNSLMETLGTRSIGGFRVSNDLVVVRDKYNVLKIIDVVNDELLNFNISTEIIDTINVSRDGRIVIGREQLGMRNATLFILDTVGG